jgi:hypothetical protein
MGMNLAQRREGWAPESDQSWLGSAHGTDTAESITLDGGAFTDTFTEGRVPSGVVVQERTSDGLFVPVSGDGDGEYFHLLEDVRVPEGGGRVGGAGLWHGQVLVDRLPADHGLTAAVADSLRNIHYRGDVPADPGA